MSSSAPIRLLSEITTGGLGERSGITRPSQRGERGGQGEGEREKERDKTKMNSTNLLSLTSNMNLHVFVIQLTSTFWIGIRVIQNDSVVYPDVLERAAIFVTVHCIDFVQNIKTFCHLQ